MDLIEPRKDKHTSHQPSLGDRQMTHQPFDHATCSFVDTALTFAPFLRTSTKGARCAQFSNLKIAAKSCKSSKDIPRMGSTKLSQRLSDIQVYRVRRKVCCQSDILSVNSLMTEGQHTFMDQKGGYEGTASGNVEVMKSIAGWKCLAVSTLSASSSSRFSG